MYVAIAIAQCNDNAIIMFNIPHVVVDDKMYRIVFLSWTSTRMYCMFVLDLPSLSLYVLFVYTNIYGLTKACLSKCRRLHVT